MDNQQRSKHRSLPATSSSEVHLAKVQIPVKTSQLIPDSTPPPIFSDPELKPKIGFKQSLPPQPTSSSTLEQPISGAASSWSAKIHRFSESVKREISELKADGSEKPWHCATFFAEAAHIIAVGGCLPDNHTLPSGFPRSFRDILRSSCHIYHTCRALVSYISLSLIYCFFLFFTWKAVLSPIIPIIRFFPRHASHTCVIEHISSLIPRSRLVKDYSLLVPPPSTYSYVMLLLGYMQLCFFTWSKQRNSTNTVLPVRCLTNNLMKKRTNIFS